MTTRHLLFAALASIATTASAAPQRSAITAADRVDIQALVTRYATALGGCDATAFADLFIPGSGYFASGIRGQVTGRERLMALVQSERHCTAAPSAAAAVRPTNAPAVVVEETASGVFGIADLGGAGRYEDEYAKTATGWRFVARTVITPAERAAGLSARDMAEIRRLAGAGSIDFYVAGQDGVRRFRTSGVALGVSAAGVTGRAHLKDGGFYDDVYAKTPDGQWRFTSRVYAADSAPAVQSAR